MPLFLRKHNRVSNYPNSSPSHPMWSAAGSFTVDGGPIDSWLMAIYRLILHFDRSCLFTGRAKLAASVLEPLLCSMGQKSIIFITVILIMLVTGVFWGTWFTLTRSLVIFLPGSLSISARQLSPMWPFPCASLCRPPCFFYCCR